jgi:glucose uptake protein
MFIIESYSSAVLLCIVTMLCWGSWANTQKLSSSTWRFELFYWDYAIGIVLASLILAFTLGSSGTQGRGFLADYAQASGEHLKSAFIGGVLFNAANILNRLGSRGFSELFSGSAGESVLNFWRGCLDCDRHHLKC